MIFCNLSTVGLTHGIPPFSLQIYPEVLHWGRINQRTDLVKEEVTSTWQILVIIRMKKMEFKEQPWDGTRRSDRVSEWGGKRGRQLTPSSKWIQVSESTVVLQTETGKSGRRAGLTGKAVKVHFQTLGQRALKGMLQKLTERSLAHLRFSKCLEWVNEWNAVQELRKVTRAGHVGLEHFCIEVKVELYGRKWA